MASTAAVAKKEAFRRLPKNVVPEHYELNLTPDLEKFIFSGSTSVRIRVSYVYRDNADSSDKENSPPLSPQLRDLLACKHTSPRGGKLALISSYILSLRSRLFYYAYIYIYTINCHTCRRSWVDKRRDSFAK